MTEKNAIYTVTDEDGVEWEVKILDDNDPNIEVRVKGSGSDKWEDAHWGIFCEHHGIDFDALA